MFGNVNIFSDEGRCGVDVGWMWGGYGRFPHGLCINSRV